MAASAQHLVTEVLQYYSLQYVTRFMIGPSQFFMLW